MIGIARLWRALILIALGAAAARAQDSVVRHVPSERLYIGTPGWVVIRDSATWVRLWNRYEERSLQGSPAPGPIPSVEFSREMLIAVSLGGTSACSNGMQYVTAVTERADSVVVTITDPDVARRGEITCMAWVRPVDVVRITRTTKPVAIHYAVPGRTAPRANWLDFPTADALDTMSSESRGELLEGVSRDPDAPLGVLRLVARRAAASGWLAAWVLRNPLARGDSTTLRIMGDGGGTSAGEADSLLLVRYAEGFARDPAIPDRLLYRMLLDLIHEPPGTTGRLAAALLRNPRLQSNRRWLAMYVNAVAPRYALVSEACQAYLGRYPAWERPAADVGDPGRMEQMVRCPNIPPNPRPPACAPADSTSMAPREELLRRMRAGIPVDVVGPDSTWRLPRLYPGELHFISDEAFCRNAFRALAASGDSRPVVVRAARGDSVRARVVLLYLRGSWAVAVIDPERRSPPTTLVVFDDRWRRVGAISLGGILPR